MMTNPHDTSAQIINTLRISGLTYSLKETPYSVYLTLRKKFVKEYSPQPLIQTHNAQEHPIENKVDNTSEHENTIIKLREALKNELAQHDATKHELSQTETEAEKLVEHINSMNTKEASKLATIHALQNELAQEVDDHAKSEHALQQLETKIANLQLEYEKIVKHAKSVDDKNESLTEKLQDAEQATRELQNSVTEKIILFHF